MPPGPRYWSRGEAVGPRAAAARRRPRRRCPGAERAGRPAARWWRPSTGPCAGGEHLLVQAGTGTGKSLAYLVPALARGRRVVVATATKALQAQLVDKDLPRLVHALARAARAHPDVRAGQGARQLPVPAAGARRAGRGAGAGGAVRGGAAVRRWRGRSLRLREWADGTADRRPRRRALPGERPGLARRCRCRARDCLGRRCPDLVDCFAEQAREAGEGGRRRRRQPRAARPARLHRRARSCPSTTRWSSTRRTSSSASATEALTARAGPRPTLRRAVSAAADAAAAVHPGAPAGRRRRAGRAAVRRSRPAGIRRLPDGAARRARAGRGGLRRRRVGGRPRRRASSTRPPRRERERARQALTDVAEAAVGAARADGRAARVYAVGEPGPCAAGLAAVGRRCAGRPAVRRVDRRRDVGDADPRRLLRPHRTAARAASAGAPAAGATTTRTTSRRSAGGPRRRQPVRLPAAGPAVGGRRPAAAVRGRAGRAAVDALLVELVAAAGGRTLGLFSSTAAAARAAAAVRAARPDLPVLLQGEDSARCAGPPLRRRRPHLPVRDPLVLAGRRHARQRLPARGHRPDPVRPRRRPAVQARLEAARAGRLPRR